MSQMNPADRRDVAARDTIESQKKKRFILSTVLASAILVVGFAGYNFYKNMYFAARDWNTYQAYDGSFEYPSNWRADFCPQSTKRVGFTLPGYIKADYIDGKKHKIFLKGTSDALCKDGRAVLATQTMQKCPSYDFGEKDHKTHLSNGMYLRLSTYKDEVSSILIHSSACARPVFSFYFKSVQ